MERLRILRPISTRLSATGGSTTSETSASTQEIRKIHTRQPSSVSPSFTRLLMPEASEARRYSTSLVMRDTRVPVLRAW